MNNPLAGPYGGTAFQSANGAFLVVQQDFLDDHVSVLYSDDGTDFVRMQTLLTTWINAEDTQIEVRHPEHRTKHSIIARGQQVRHHLATHARACALEMDGILYSRCTDLPCPKGIVPTHCEG